MLLVLLVTGCPEPKDSTAPVADECAADEACGWGEICDDGACAVGDRNDEMGEDTTPLVWEEDLEAEIAPDGDVDWYAIEAAGGEFVRAATEVSDEEDLDTVVSLYDDVGHRITWEDEHPMSDISGLDSVAYGYFPEAGTYWVKVEHAYSFYGEGSTGVDRASYVLSVRALDAADETDALDDPAFDLDTLSGNTWYSLPVLFESDGDVDYIVFEMPYTNAPISIAAMSNDETSEATPSVSLYNSAAELVLTMDDPDVDVYARLPDALDTRYTLAVTDADGESGALHWTWVFMILRDEGDPNPREVEPNEDVETSTTLDVTDQEPDSGTWYSGFGGGWIDPVTDVDTWAVVVPEDDLYLTVALGSQRYGGLLVGRVEVLDAAGTVLSTTDSPVGEDEGPTNLGPYAAGTVYVRISASPDAVAVGGEGSFYQFGAHLTSEPVDD